MKPDPPPPKAKPIDPRGVLAPRVSGGTGGPARHKSPPRKAAPVRSIAHAEADAKAEGKPVGGDTRGSKTGIERDGLKKSKNGKAKAASASGRRAGSGSSKPKNAASSQRSKKTPLEEALAEEDSDLDFGLGSPCPDPMSPMSKKFSRLIPSEMK